MILYKHKKDIQSKLQSVKAEGKSIGFVPTMGALHDGHLSLIEACRKQNDVTVCSIFINPTQFNNSNDFKKYPVTIETDILKLIEAGTDILFFPSVHEMYPDGTQAVTYYDLGELERLLEGKYRPGHFQGVCNVVHRLFNIVQPHTAFFGQKDYQQCMVIKKLVQLENLPVTIIVYPTVREESGLAMSSRNLRLSEDEKDKAAVLYKALTTIKKDFGKTNTQTLLSVAQQMIMDSGFESIDYLEIRDADTLQPVENGKPGKPAVALVAAFLSEVRLIDNILL